MLGPFPTAVVSLRLLFLAGLEGKQKNDLDQLVGMLAINENYGYLRYPVLVP